MNSFQMTNLLYLARSICLSLGFNEAQRATPQEARDYSSATLEEMRAYAGCYYLVTVVFTTNKRPDALMNTAYLETACRVLEERREYPTDELLVYLVRVQQLAQSISLTLAPDTLSFQSMQLPLSIIVKGFQAQLDTFKASLPPHLQNHREQSAPSPFPGKQND